MYQRAELFSTLEQEDISSTLSACTLVDKSEYTEKEADRFRSCRELFEQGMSYQQVAAHFRRTDKNLKQGDGKGEVDEAEAMLEISELLSLASTQCETRITLKEAAVILDSCGLPDTEFYTSEQGDRFLEACDLIKKENKTYSDVAAHFGVSSDLLASDRTRDGIEASIESTASNLDISGNGIVSEVMRSKAKADASAAASMYLQHLSNEFGSAEFQSSWHQMESALKAKVMGKSQQRAKQILGDLRAIPPSTSPLNALPEASDNGSSTS
jgi:hypothetical protein